MSSPLIDVLIPVYNGASTIESALSSIQLQTVEDIAIYVVDDGSTDRTAELLSDMAQNDPRVRIISKPNGGIVDALNLGLAHCTAPFVARFDADDLAYPERFAQQLDYLRHNLECVATAGSAKQIDAEGKLLGTIARLDPPDGADADAIPAKEPYLLHPFLMARRDALMRIGGYRHVLHAEDADLYWRLQEIGRLHNDTEFHGEYRIHPNSVTSLSVVSGRQTAVSSQLCALSARRRRSGRPDIVFDRRLNDDLKTSDLDLEAGCRLASAQLDADEARHLRIASAAKLLELADYRPYEIEMSDCDFIRNAVARNDDLLTPADRRMLKVTIVGTAARLARAGKWREARALTTGSLYLRVAARLIVRGLLSDNRYRQLRDTFKPLRAFVRRSRG